MKRAKTNEPIWETKEFEALKEHVSEIKKTHLRDLIKVRQTYSRTRRNSSETDYYFVGFRTIGIHDS